MTPKYKYLFMALAVSIPFGALAQPRETEKFKPEPVSGQYKTTFSQTKQGFTPNNTDSPNGGLSASMRPTAGASSHTALRQEAISRHQDYQKDPKPYGTGGGRPSRSEQP
jgi:hypothetical protein